MVTPWPAGQRQTHLEMSVTKSTLTSIFLKLVVRLRRKNVPNVPPEYFYRYRSARHVLETFEELEREEIFFSKTDALNDPMEGFKDLFWSGDEIVWRNLFRHYVLCLLDSTYHVFIMGPEYDHAYTEKAVFIAPDALPNGAPIREIYEKLSTAFVEEQPVKKLISVLANRKEPVRRNELRSYLRVLHPLAINRIFADVHERGLWPDYKPFPEDRFESLRQTAVKVIEHTAKNSSRRSFRKNLRDTLFALTDTSSEQFALMLEANAENREAKRGILFLTSRFPAAYVAALDKTVHSDWYVACFTTRPDNHSMWSTYGDGHKGVCLIFKPTPNQSGEPSLFINRMNGQGGTIANPTYHYDFAQHPLERVQYAAEYPAIDFFRSLGTIRQSFLNSFWYRGEDGSLSSAHAALYNNEEAWRAQYWKTFRANALYKTPEWSHEEEYRIVAHSFFDMSAPEARKLKFKFEELAGIVFGARTTDEDKVTIMRIIEKKCVAAARSDFQFKEVRYFPGTGFRVYDLPLLKIKSAATAESNPIHEESGTE
jgi:hypothetical protein